MSMKAILQFMLGLALAILASAGAQAVDQPSAANELMIESSSDVNAELAPCG